MKMIKDLFHKIDLKIEQKIYNYYQRAKKKKDLYKLDSELKYANKMITAKDYIKRSL